MADAVCLDPLRGERWRDIRRLTDRPSAYAVPWFEPGLENMAALQKMRVLVVGAGGLGCELLKNLALSGFQNLDVIDMDTIDISNLNRQFLFRMSDVGKSKAEVAAAFVQSRVSGCTVTAHNCRIEDKPPSFYRQFSLIICGLDSIAARRWINGMLCDLVIVENGEVDTTTVIPLIDGGTEGFKGNARVIYPKLSACVDCTLDLFPPQVNYPLCTIAHTPRLPEHCIEYIKVIQWAEEAPFNGASLDADDPAHVEWVLDRATARAQKYGHSLPSAIVHTAGIKGVDRRLTQGVLKRIIPAVASTNAVIAASCALEAIKLATNAAKPIDNYLNFTDIEGVYCGVVKMEKDPECPTCSGGYVQMQCHSGDTLQMLIDKLVEKFHLKNPSIETVSEKLYMINELLPELKSRSVSNLMRPLGELILAGEDLLVADEVLSKSLSIRVNFITVSIVKGGLGMDTVLNSVFTISKPKYKPRMASFKVNVKPRRPCTVCGKWTTAIFMHMIYSHNWNEQQIDELKMTIRNERISGEKETFHECRRCGLGFTSKSQLATHLTTCRPKSSKAVKHSAKTVKEKQFEYSLDGRQSKHLPTRPPIMPPLPEQLSESDKGSVLCPVPRCRGRFTNHDSLSYHCMIEHSELGAAGTPQNFAIRQYRFETKEEYKEWLYERCEETCTSFSTKTSMWSGYAMYRCNRAGTFRTSGTIRSGCTSKKTQSHCSAFLRTSEYTDGSVDVTCCFGHIFHELDPTALRLNERQCGVLRKAIEEQKCLTDICAEMKAKYPPSNRLHYTSSNDIRNLAIRLGLPVHIKVKKPGESGAEGNVEEGEDGQADDDVEDDAMSETAPCDDSSSEHSDLEIDDEELLSVHGVQEQLSEHSSPDKQSDEARSPSPTASTKDSSPDDDTESRPARTRRVPRRFVDD